MKKTGLFKIIMFTLIGMIIASWIISASYFESGVLSDLGMNYTGLFNSFEMFFKSFLIDYFVQVLLLLLAVGGLYGVLAKSGVYKKLVNKIVDDLKGREFLFMVLASLFIAILTSVFDYGFGFVIVENSLGKLPSECVDFISLGNQTSGILSNELNNYYHPD